MVPRLAGRCPILVLAAVLLPVSVLLLHGAAPSSPESSVIVLVGLESTRADHLPCYGYDRVTAPNVCALAEDGVLFERAYAQGSWTPVSVPSLLTARTPREVGMWWREGTGFSENLSTFPEVLQNHGYRTARRPSLPRFTGMGLLQGFDRPVPFETFVSALNDGNGLYFTFFPQYAHTPYAPPDRFRLWDNLSWSTASLRDRAVWGGFARNASTETLIDLYDAEIRTADARIGGMVDRLREEDLYEDAMVVVFADHGEGFGEHGRIADHAGMPYEEVVHVPLIIKFPGNRFAGTRVEQPVSLVSVPHTIFDVLGFDVTFGSVGSSLLSLVDAADETGGRTVFAARTPTDDWMVRRGNWTYLLANPFDVCLTGAAPDDEELYHVGTDPMQRTDVADARPSDVERLREELCRLFMAGNRNPAWFTGDPLSERMRERLAHLGYLE